RTSRTSQDGVRGQQGRDDPRQTERRGKSRERPERHGPRTGGGHQWGCLVLTIRGTSTVRRYSLSTLQGYQGICRWASDFTKPSSVSSPPPASPYRESGKEAGAG